MDLLETLLSVNDNSNNVYSRSQTNLIDIDLVQQPPITSNNNNLRSLPARPPPPPPSIPKTDNFKNETCSSSHLFFLNDNGYAQFSTKKTPNEDPFQNKSVHVNMQKPIQGSFPSDPFNMDPFNVNMQTNKNADPFGMQSLQEVIQPPIAQPRIKIGKKLPINQDILLLGDPGIY
jgi:hypothetical protein